MRSSNPVLNVGTMDAFRGEYFAVSQSMTIQGTATKALILLGLCFGTGTMTFAMTHSGNSAAAFPWLIAGFAGSLIFSIATSFKPNWAPVTAPLYALAEGLLLGAISGMYEGMFSGIVPQAALATLGTLGAMLFAYKTALPAPHCPPPPLAATRDSRLSRSRSWPALRSFWSAARPLC